MFVPKTRCGSKPHHSVNLAIFDNISSQLRVDAAPTGLGFVKQRFSTEIPSLRDSRGFCSLQGFRVGSGSVRNRTYRAGGEGGYFFLN